MGILNKNKIKIHINKKDNRDDSFKFLNLEVPKISLLFFAVTFILVIIFLIIIFKDKTKVLLTLFFMISLIFLFFNIKNKIKINRYYKQMSKCIEDCEKNNYIDIIDFLVLYLQKIIKIGINEDTDKISITNVNKIITKKYKKNNYNVMDMIENSFILYSVLIIIIFIYINIR